jgi:predicted O-methyltransferase YrrM
MAEKYFEKAGLKEKVKYMIGNAVQLIPQLNVKFDLVFIDADKENYSTYYDLIFDKLNSGGVILADNVLWSGKVLDEKKDVETNALVEFSKKIQQDERVENILITIRDGVMMIRKK